MKRKRVQTNSQNWGGDDLPKHEAMEFESLPSSEGVEVPSSNESKQKKVKVGSKARRLLKLQIQQRLKGLDKNLNQTSGTEISEEDLRKREAMELKRLEKLPSEETEVEIIDMSAWARLRLHPLLMKALMKSRFIRPTLIQEACIGASAFQGKDVIGTAETGSGKKLAFGLTILQRLLDDEEKHHKKSGFDDTKKKQSADLSSLLPQGSLRCRE